MQMLLADIKKSRKDFMANTDDIERDLQRGIERAKREIEHSDPELKGVEQDIVEDIDAAVLSFAEAIDQKSEPA